MESPGAAPAGCSPASAIPQQINNFFTFIKTLSVFFINQSEFDISIQPYRGCRLVTHGFSRGIAALLIFGFIDAAHSIYAQPL